LILNVSERFEGGKRVDEGNGRVSRSKRLEKKERGKERENRRKKLGRSRVFSG